MNNSLKQQIQQHIDAPIKQIHPLSGGMISQVMKVEFDDHKPLVAKVGGNHDLSIEGYMLTYLKEHSNLPIPDVTYSDGHLLLMDYIDGRTGLNPSTQANLARLLAGLHHIKGSQYGLERDTLIGPIHQPNPLSDSWIDFFRQHRLLYMAKIALESGSLGQTYYDRILKLADNLDKFLIEPEFPVLIHGDMWTTNILIKDDNIVGIIDPALYYAHNEIELAYMTLFGSVGQAFFDSYTKINPVDSAFFDTRRHIYNLYPLLVHVTIFGSQYTSYVQSTLNRFGF